MWRPRSVAYHLALLVDGNPRAASEIAADWVSEYREIEALTNLPETVLFVESSCQRIARECEKVESPG